MRIADHLWREAGRSRAYSLGFVIWLVSLAAVFARPLYQLAIHAAHSNLHSHILLIPFVSAYLIYLQRKSLPTRYYSSPGLAVIPWSPVPPRPRRHGVYDRVPGLSVTTIIWR
jgi:hypothetical protein